MAKNVSEKKPLFGNSRSHALNHSRKKQKPNMQTVIANGEKVIMTTREAKKLKKNNIA